MSANTVVRTNVLSLNSHRNLGMVSNQQARASQRLSSGFRINSAADDAAGLGISEKMRAQIRGLDQASRNAQDGISLIQTAEGALDTVNEILIRVRELVVQAANDTNVGGTGAQSDRLRIQDEIDQLMDEIDAIAGRTEFNTRTLLDGGLSQRGTIEGGEWTTVDQVRINAPAQIQSLDQFLRTTSNAMFTGSLSELLTAIGINEEGLEVNEWLALRGFADSDTLTVAGADALAYAIDRAMGVSSANGVVVGTATSTGAGTAGATSTQWQQLRTSSGLTFTNATDMLNSFVRGLHNPNALREGNMAGQAQQGFDTWSDFRLQAGTGSLGATTFSNAISSAGGETIYQALRRTGFGGLDSTATFAQVRNALYVMNGNSVAGGGAGGGTGWGTATASSLRSAIVSSLNDNTGNGASWLATRFGNLNPDGSGSFVAGNGFAAGAAGAQQAWDAFVATYMRADSEIVQRDVWVPNEAERNRGVALWFQVGANSGQGISVEIGSMSTGTLFGREGANHTTDRRIINVMDEFGYNVQAGSVGGSNFGNGHDGPVIGGNRVTSLLEAIDSALSVTTRQRSELGAVQNRLEFSIENLDIASENLSAANSRIRDADMAREMMGLTQANVLQQAAISMLAQANQAPQSVLQLLG